MSKKQTPKYRRHKQGPGRPDRAFVEFEGQRDGGRPWPQSKGSAPRMDWWNGWAREATVRCGAPEARTATLR